MNVDIVSNWGWGGGGREGVDSNQLNVVLENKLARLIVWPHTQALFPALQVAQ